MTAKQKEDLMKVTSRPNGILQLTGA